MRSKRRSSTPWRLRQPRRPDVAIPVADYHKQAKDAGNKLKAYVLTYASAAAGVYFLAIAGGGSKDAVLSTMQKRVRLKLIYASYVTALIATCGSMIYLGTRIF